MKSPWNFGLPPADGLYFVSLPSHVRGMTRRLFFVAAWKKGRWTGLPDAWGEAITQWMMIPEPLAEMNLNVVN